MSSSNKRSATGSNADGENEAKKQRQPEQELSVYAWGFPSRSWMQSEGQLEYEKIVRIPNIPTNVQAISTSFRARSRRRGDRIRDGKPSEALPEHSYVLLADGTIKKMWPDEHILAGDQVFSSISSGYGHFVGVLKGSGKLVTWGRNAYGQCGQNSQGNDDVPPAMVSLPCNKIVQVSCGTRHSLALTETGIVCSWGDNKCNGLGLRARGHQKNPCPMYHLHDVTHISTKHLHSVAGTIEGHLYSWGTVDDNDDSLSLQQLLGHGGSGETPVQVSEHPWLYEETKIKILSCGENHTFVVFSDGGVFCWGDNSAGQLGLGNCESYQGMQAMLGLKGLPLKKIVCGANCTFAITLTGEIYSWGEEGTHAHLNHEDVHLPKKIEALASLFVSDVLSQGKIQVVLASPRTKDFSLVRGVPEFHEKNSVTNVTFIVEGQQLHAHTFVLAQRCGYFQTMFSSGMKEASTQGEIPIRDVQYDTFLKLLDYLYTDKIGITKYDVLELFRLADMYDLPQLGDLCCWKMEGFLSAENVVEFLQCSDSPAFEEIRNICLGFARYNWKFVSKDPKFKSLVTKELLQEITEGLKRSLMS